MNDVDSRRLAEQLLAQAKEQGVDLVGPDGLLNKLTKRALQTALDAEMTEIGPMEIEVPRDTNSSFEP